MNMPGVSYLVFGYRRLKISPDSLSFLSSILLKAAIPSRISNNGDVIVRERDIDKISTLLSGRIEFSCSEPKGLYGIFKRVPNKVAVVLSLLASLVLVFFLSELVWDIRVEGNGEIAEEEILLALKESGFEIGDFWRRIDTGEVEATLLSMKDNLAWVNINRRGSVAYVKVMEKDCGKEPSGEKYGKYSNIVATCDCVIEEITLKRGRALVKVGDAVKKGQILVLGMGSDDFGGELTSAEATVIGRVNRELSVEVDRKSEIKGYNEGKICSVTLNLFKISLNIFKNYGNLTNECVIIEDEIEYTLPGNKKLPFSITKAYGYEESKVTVEYTDEELIRLASQRLNDMTLKALENADLLRIKTYGEFTDTGYSMRSDVVFLTEVSKCVEFTVD